MDYDTQYLLEGLILSVVCVFGIFTNIAGMLYFGKNCIQKETFYGLMFSLSITDFLFNMLCLCVFSIPALADCKGYTDEDCNVPKMFWQCLVWLVPLSNILRTVIIYLTLALSVERYFVICKPFLYKRKQRITRLVILSIILFSVLFNFPKFFEFEWKNEKMWINGTHDGGISQTNLATNWYYATLYVLGGDLILNGLVPFMSLICLNVLVLKEMIKFKRNIKNETEEARKRVVQVHMARFNFLIVMIFIICYSLHFASATIYLWYRSISMDPKCVIELCEEPLWLWEIVQLSRVMEGFNSSATFVWFLFKHRLLEKIYFNSNKNRPLLTNEGKSSQLEIVLNSFVTS